MHEYTYTSYASMILQSLHYMIVIVHSLTLNYAAAIFRSHRLTGTNNDHLDEKLSEEEFSPVRHRSRSATEVIKMLQPPEPLLSAIK